MKLILGLSVMDGNSLMIDIIKKGNLGKCAGLLYRMCKGLNLNIGPVTAILKTIG